MRLIDFYKNVLLLTDEALIHEAVDLSEVKTMKQGDYLIRQSEVPTHMCFLLNGILRAFMLDVNGKDMTDCIVCRCGELCHAGQWFYTAGFHYARGFGRL